jgi:hypothetical protein
MSRLPSEPILQPRSLRDAGWEHYAIEEHERRRRGPSGWMIAGLALVGLGALTWYFLGPDFKRYMKIRSM